MIVGPVRGVMQLAAAISAKQKAISNGVAKAITRGALLVQSRARKRIMNGPKSGRVYGKNADVMNYTVNHMMGNKTQQRKAAAKVHVASAPGEPPANETGNLARKINVINATESNGVWTAKVTANTKYAAALEFGTRRAGRSRRVAIQERPFLRPSLAEAVDEIDKDIKRAVAEGLSK
jgi:phage gpG-like protein